MVPFWIFRGTFHFKYTYQVGHRNDRGRVKHWERIDWSSVREFKMPQNHECMQVCGSFKYRHDFVDILKGKHVPNITIPKEFAGNLIDIDLSRGLAWTFVLRNIIKKQTEDIKRELDEKHVGCLVKDIKIHLSGISNHSELVYLPAYCIDYVYGEKINVHGERVPNKFYAIVGAFGGDVASTVHVSVKKSSFIGGVVAAAGMQATSLLGYNTGLEWSFFDYLFISTGAAATSGLFSQVIPEIIKQSKDQEILSQFDDGTKYGAGLSNNNLQDSELIEEGRNLSEWARWEHGTRDSCDPEKRKRWAESLWRSHIDRLRSMRRIFAGRQEAERRREEEMQRRRRREAQWGPQRKTQTVGHRNNGRDPDFLGYYKILGLDPRNIVTQHEIKQHFYKRVLKYHPDKHRDSAEKLEAKQNFQYLVKAYEVLKHPATRKKYDAGDYKE